MKHILLAAIAALAFSFVPAAAQSGCSTIVYGAVLTAAQWNACFQGKQDSLFLTGTSGGVVYFSSSTTLAGGPTLGINQIVLGGGVGAAPTSLGSTGTTAQVLHGNASGAPTFGAVNAATDLTGIVPAANGGAGAVNGILKANGSGLVTGTTIGAGLAFDGTTLSATNAGSVTSVGQTFTGGLISVSGSPVTSTGTLALTVAGTSGGIPYFSGASTWASSSALAANALMIGGGAGVAPSTTTTGSGILTFLGTPSSANLAAALTDETGTGAAVFANGPTLIAPVLGTIASGVGTSLTALNASNLSSGTVATGRLPVGKSVVAANSVLESTLPIQTSTGASKTFATADIQLETRRSNSGSAMTDTFPASSDPGAVNGARITLNNGDATASDTITPGSGTTISSCTTVPAGRSATFVYDLANTTWRTTFNTCTAGVFASAALGSQVAGHLVTMLNANGGIQDSGIVSTAIPTSNLATTLNAKTGAYTIATTDAGKINYLNNASPFTFTVPAAGTLGANFATDLGNIGAGLLTNTIASGTFADTGNASITTVQGQELYTWVDAGAAGVHSWVSMPPVASNNLLANVTGNTDYPKASTLTALIDAALGSTRGSILERGASGWTILAPSSTSGQALASNGTGADPTYQTISGGTGCTVSGTAGQAVYNNGSTGCLSSAATFSSGGGLTLPLAGAASAPGLTVSGAPYTGGSTTTNFPQLYINSGGAVSTFASTGTAFGVNLPSASTANFLDFHVNGGASVFNVSSAGATVASGLNMSGTSGSVLNLGSSGVIQASGTTKISFSGGLIDFSASTFWGASGAALNATTPTATSASMVPNGTNNSGLGAASAGVVDLIANSVDVARAVSTGLVMETGVFTLKSFAFSGLPGSPATGSMAYITDQVAACVYGATPVGSGSNVCKVFYNGTAWIDG